MSTELSKRQLESAKEIVIPVWPKELYKGYIKLIHDKPIEWYGAIARKLDDVSINKRLRTGFNAFLTMPLAIIGRNTARSAHHLADGDYHRPTQVIGGGVGAAAAWWFGGKAAFAYLTTQAPVISGIVSGAGVLGATAKIATLVATTVVAGLVVVPPAFMVGTLALATVGAAVVAAVSTIPAALNIRTGLKRTWFRMKGVKGVDFDGPEELKEIADNSLSSRYEREAYRTVQNNLWRLSDSTKKELYEGLKKEFDQAAAPANQNQPVPTPVAQPAAVSKPTP